MRSALAAGSAERVRQVVSREFGGFWDGFQAYATEPLDWHEWRFQGTLGSGGKLHLSRYRGPYVSAYPEDLTPERREAIERVNERLAGLSLMFQTEKESA